MSIHHARIPSRIWQRFRYSILDRDGWRCVRCGRSGRLEVDHIRPLEKGGSALDPANCQTLCRTPCHIEKTRRDRGKPLSGERVKWREFIETLW